MAAPGGEGAPAPAPARAGREGGRSAGLGCWREPGHECGPGGLCSLGSLCAAPSGTLQLCLLQFLRRKPRFAHPRGRLKRAVPGWEGAVVWGDQAVPPGCVQDRALWCLCNAGRVPALIQSRDAIGFTSALEIWDGAGRGSVMHQSGSQYSLCGRGSLSQWPARPPMGAIQALLITVSHRAVRVGHIPHLSTRTPAPPDKRLRSFSGGTRDRQNSPRIFTKTRESSSSCMQLRREGDTGDLV